MGKPHGQGRYAALRLAVAGLCTVRVSILLAGVLLLCPPDASALDPALDVSQYAHTAWKVREGFFKGSIYAIAQSQDGYLWLGTEFGLLRFDGVRAVPWEPPTGENLPSRLIRSLLISRDGTLWIGTEKGLACWKDGNLTEYLELTGLAVDAILEDREGTVWVGETAIGIGRLCAIQNASAQCYGEDGSLGGGVESLYEDSLGNLWAATANGLWRWKPGPSKFYRLTDSVPTSQVLSEDGGVLLIATSNGVRQLANGKVKAYTVPGVGAQFKPNKLFRDRNGSLWIGARNRGLVHIHQGKIDVFAQSDGLSDDAIQRFFEDREGNVWAVTLGGLDRFRDFAVSTISVKQGLSDAHPWSVLAAGDGSVWLGTAYGLNRWKDGQVTVYRKRHTQTAESQPRAGTVREISDSGLPDDGVQSLGQDNRGRIWVSAHHGTAYFENGRFVTVSGVPGGNVYSIAQDGAADLWINHDSGGIFHLIKESVVEQIRWTKLGREEAAVSLLADPLQEGIWLGFSHGGVAYFKEGQVRALYAVSNGLGEGRVNTLRLDADGALWAATDGGLGRLKNGRIGNLTSKNGLPCDAVHWSMEDNEHSVWLYMACGLVRTARTELDAWITDQKRTIRLTVFDSSDGVRNQASIGAYSPHVAKTTDGNLWFISGDGVSVIDPRHLSINNVPPPVHIEQIIADRKTYWQNWTHHAPSSPPKLPPLVRDLTIDYTALSLVAPEKVRFHYKLEGRDRDWQDAGNRRQAFYTDLPPRNYRFRVVACNNSGVWNETGAFLDFSVAPAYYQTTWFRLSSVTAFLFLLWALYQLRLRQLAREYNTGLEARVNERTRIARELHDSLLQGFQGLMFRLQAVREFLPGRPSDAMKALDIALERGDKVIVEGRDTISDLRQSTIGDSDIAQALTALGEELAAQSENGCAPCVRVLVEGEQRELNPVLRDEVYRIGREALRNAFRHAKAQKIEAEITYGDSEFVLHVRDDGIGISPEVADQGARAGHWGLPGMRERAKSFGGKLEVWSEHGAGTEIELKVPAAVIYGKSSAHDEPWFLRKKN
jgi:signal transduction histidine kinase/ligand-binding sensor domain-containing protein